ncbi:MAG: dihydroneopterin aldolase [Clostridiales Family XIII bacterium]|jgi:dihydroneopterin aldolase|nr:dihydroneopterin aldolase [Clostridiales Family XIII bacterium]
MDKIIMENMAFYGYHGVLHEEKTLGQKFFIDAYLYLSLKEAGETDDLNFSADYGAVYETIKKIVTGERFKLIEGLAERLCGAIFSSNPQVMKIRIRVKKPEAPVHGIFDYFGVEIERTRPV